MASFYFSLFALFLSFPSRRASNFVSYYVLRSSLSLWLPFLPFIARTCHSSPLFLSCRLSSTRFSGISPPVHRQDVPDEEAAHTSLPGTLVSSPGRVSGARLRARFRTQTRTHLSSSVLHPNVCQRPRNFVCVHIIYVTLCAQTRVLILLILLFPRHPRIFSFFSSYREIDQRVFPHIFRYLFFSFFFQRRPRRRVFVLGSVRDPFPGREGLCLDESAAPA